MKLSQENWSLGESEWITTAILSGMEYSAAVAEYSKGHNRYQGRWEKNIYEAEAVANHAIDVLVDSYGMVIDKRVLSWGRSRKRSWGGRWSNGRHGMTLAMKRYTPADHVDPDSSFTFYEYERFAASPTIGDFTGRWQDCIRVLVAHEFAHALLPLEGHGVKWQEKYAECRKIVLS